MTPEQLKASILQYAIQGKLVEQRVEEGTAEELYQQIQDEKQRLIKEKKIKKEKPLAEITEDEIPFDIPESWKWCRLGGCGCFERGSGIKKGEVTPAGFPCVRYGQLYTTYKTRFKDVVSYIPQDIYEKCHKAHSGDILMALTGENEYDIALAVTYEGNEEIAMGGDMTKFFNHCMNPLYLTYVLNSHYGILCKSKLASGNIIVHISNDKLASILIPLPPLEEQHRIVAKIEELLPFVDCYAKAYEKLEKFNAKFPEDMKKSILQYAIQGKLVEQRPEEGTAEELYQQIQEEKQRLIKEKKIKKEKPLAEITEDEIPFDIPESWKWVRIGNIFSLQAGKNIKSSNIVDNQSNDYPYLCYGGNGVRGYVDNPNRSGHYAIIGRQGALCGCINFAEGDFYATEHAVVVNHFNITDVKWSGLFLKALNLNQYATATAQPGLAVSNINQVLIPLPPLEEQHRIVAKIEELLPYCDQLIK